MVKVVLVYRCGALGDNIVALPVYNALRKHYKTAKIILMTQSNEDGVLWGNKFLGKFDIFDSFLIYGSADVRSVVGVFRLIQRVRNLKPDLVVNLPNDKASLLRNVRDYMFFKMAVGADYVSAVCDKVNLLGQIKNSGRAYPKETSRLMSAVAKLGISVSNIEFRAPHLPDELARVAAFIDKHKLYGKFIVVCPGSKMSVKRWPVEKYIETCRRVFQELGLRICLIGDGADIETCKKIKESLPSDACAIAANVFSVLGSMELIRKAEFYLGNDTGAMHLAAAVGKPCVSIFASRDAKESWFPWGDRNICFFKDISCSGCMLTECESMACIKSITSEEVFAACKKIKVSLL